MVLRLVKMWPDLAGWSCRMLGGARVCSRAGIRVLGDWKDGVDEERMEAY